MLVSWLGWSAFGAFLGMFLAWLWASGSIYRATRYQDKEVPDWMKSIYGGFKKEPIFSPSRAHIPAWIMSAAGLFVSLFFYHYAFWSEVIQFKGTTLLVELSFPTFLLATWGGLIWWLQRFLRKRPRRIA